MIVVVVVAAAFALASQAQAPPDPSTTPPVEQSPPVVPLAPSHPSTTPSTPNASPPTTTPPTTTPPTTTTPPKPDARTKPEVREGLEPLPTAAVQLGAGVGACCVGSVIGTVPCLGLSLIPIAGPVLGPVACALISGGSIGGVEAYVGDAFGQQRAPALWPIIAGVAPMLATAAVFGAYDVFATANISPTSSAAQQQDFINRSQGAVVAVLAVVSIAPVVAVALPAALYAATAVDKKPGDTGQGLPGLLDPASPQPAGPKHIKIAMAY